MLSGLNESRDFLEITCGDKGEGDNISDNTKEIGIEFYFRSVYSPPNSNVRDIFCNKLSLSSTSPHSVLYVPL
jgi:hypothetical protein